MNDVSEIPLNNSINVYPNPANEILNVIIDEQAEIVIEDLSGKVLKSLRVSNSFSEDVSKMPSGIYILKIISKVNNPWNKLIIIQH